METARENWAELDGYAVAHGLGYLQELPLDRFFNFVWHMFTRNADAKDLAQLKARLWKPDPGQVVTDPRSPWYSKNEGKSLSDFKRGLGG